MGQPNLPNSCHQLIKPMKSGLPEATEVAESKVQSSNQHAARVDTQPVDRLQIGRRSLLGSQIHFPLVVAGDRLHCGVPGES